MKRLIDILLGRPRRLRVVMVDALSDADFPRNIIGFVDIDAQAGEHKVQMAMPKTVVNFVIQEI